MTVTADGAVAAAHLVGPDAVGRHVASAVDAMSEPEMVAEVRDSAARVGPQAHDVRRPVRRLPLGRPGLLDQRRADGRADRRAGADLLDGAARARALRRAALRARGRAPLRHRPPRGPRRRAVDARVRARARLPPGRAAVGLDGGAAALRHAGWRARPARSSSRSARAPTSSSTATRATSTTAASWCRSSAGCRGRSAAPVGALAVHATSRAGRAVRHGEALYDAGHSRIPYWGGALCFRGPLKERLLRHDHRRRPADGRAHLGRGRRPPRRRRPLPAHDLPRAAPAPARAAAGAHGPDRDGQLGRGPRAVPRPRARRARDGAARRG